MNKLIDSLKAVAEPTRLRLMNLCSKINLPNEIILLIHLPR